MGKETSTFHHIAACGNSGIESLSGGLSCHYHTKSVIHLLASLHCDSRWRSYIIGHSQKRWKLLISHVELLKGFCDLKPSFL